MTFVGRANKLYMGFGIGKGFAVRSCRHKFQTDHVTPLGCLWRIAEIYRPTQFFLGFAAGQFIIVQAPLFIGLLGRQACPGGIGQIDQDTIGDENDAEKSGEDPQRPGALPAKTMAFGILCVHGFRSCIHSSGLRFFVIFPVPGHISFFRSPERRELVHDFSTFLFCYHESHGIG